VDTVRRALQSEEPPRYRRVERPSKLDRFREEIHRLLREGRRAPGQVIRERVQELRCSKLASNADAART
jgi:hypothetical protein